MKPINKIKSLPRTLSAKLPLLLLSGGLILSTSTFIHAEETTDETGIMLPTMDVVGDTVPEEQATGYVEGYKASRSTTGTKTDTHIRNVPQSVSVISAEQLRDQNAQTLQEAIAYSAGVRAETYGLDNRGDWFTIRGSSESSVLQDGLRQPLSGYYGFVRNEPYAYERIEILRGPSSVIAGQNAPGGVVNMVSKLPQKDLESEVGLELGNNEHKQLNVDISEELNDSVYYRVVGLVKDSETQIEHADEKRHYLAPSITWEDDDTQITVYAQYQKDESQNTNAFLGWEGTLYPIMDSGSTAQGKYIPSDWFVGEPDWDTYGGTRVRGGYQIAHQINDTWAVKHQTRYDDLEGEQKTMYASWWTGFTGANGTELDRIYYGSIGSTQVLNSELLFEGKLNSGNIAHTVLVGIDAMSMNDDMAYDSGSATPLDLFNPVYGTFPEPNFDFSSSAAGWPLKSERFGILLQDQLEIGERLVVTAGLRRDKVDTEIENGTPEQQINDSATTTRLGAVYHLDSGWSPYISYSESFEPIAGLDTSLNAFKPKEGEQIEVGAKWMPDNSNTAFTIAAYELKELNRPMDDANDPDLIDPYDQIQKGEVTVQGLELESMVRSGTWDLTASYSYTDAVVSKTELGDTSKGKQLASIPKQTFSLWAVNNFSIGNYSGIRVGGGARFVGETSDGYDGIKVPHNTIFDAMASYTNDHWRYSLNINNLFDEEYIATALARGDVWFGTQRRIVGSVNYTY